MGRPKKVKPPIASANIDTNKLTLTDIIEDNKKYDELVKVEFPNGKYTEVYRYFDNVRLDEMLVDFSKYLDEYAATIGEFPQNKLIDYINLHVIVHFSTLVDRLPADIHEKANVFKQMLKSKLVETVFAAFDKNELENVFSRIFEKLEATQNMLKQNVEIRKQIKDYLDNSNLQNKDIIRNVMFGDEGNGE